LVTAFVVALLASACTPDDVCPHGSTKSGDQCISNLSDVTNFPSLSADSGVTLVGDTGATPDQGPTPNDGTNTDTDTTASPDTDDSDALDDTQAAPDGTATTDSGTPPGDTAGGDASAGAG